MTLPVQSIEWSLRMHVLARCLCAALPLGSSTFAVAQSSLPAPAVGEVASPASGGRHALAFARLRALPGSPRTASTILVVQNCNDSGTGSLRDAMSAAIDGDTIDASQLPCSTITLTSGAVSTQADTLHLIGPGAPALDVSGNQQSSVLYHFGSGTLGVSGITLADGSYRGANNPTGGCVYSSGSVALYDTVVRGCALAVSSTHFARGGGVYAKNDLTLSASRITGNVVENLANKALGGGFSAGGSIAVAYSTISDNVATATQVDGKRAYGGGLINSGNVLIAGSTVSGNEADGVGGAFLNGFTATQPLTIVESTISGNAASLGVGGLWAGQGTSRIVSSTIAYNTEGVATGAGLYAYESVQLESTIIAGNTAAAQAADIGALSVATVSGHYNLIRHSLNASLPADTIDTDPRLAPLADNGGATKTHALQTGSGAIDHGDNFGAFAVDQRGPGFPRVVGAGADIGAFEAGNDRIFADGFD